MDEYYSSNSYQLNNIPNHVKSGSDDMIHNSEKHFDYDYDEPKKSTRSCKGKRYLEFMNRKTNPVLKKNKVRTSSSSSSSSTSQPLSPNGIHSVNGQLNLNHAQKMDVELSDHLYAASKTHETIGTEDLPWSPTTTTVSEGSKLFSADDFDLEEKIKTLPALNLDKYLTGKRTVKKKRKLTSRRHNTVQNRKQSSHTANNITTVNKSPKTVEEAKAQLMVGSQKRKARKESITRRDIGVPLLVSTVIEPAVTTYAPILKSPIYDLPNVPNNLFILATMAERVGSIEV